VRTRARRGAAGRVELDCVTPHVDCVLERPCGAAGGVSASDTTRARASMVSAGENGEQQHYLGIVSSDASTVARSGGLRWTGEMAISRRSFGRQTDGSALDRSRGREKIGKREESRLWGGGVIAGVTCWRG
jgi:hypothetical protein